MSIKLSHPKSCIEIVLITQILAGLILLGTILYFHFILKVFLAKIEHQLLLSLMSIFYILGCEVLICSFIELILWQKIRKCDTMGKPSRCLLLWNFFCTFIIVFGSVTVWFQQSNLENLECTYETSLYQGIDLYFTDPEWKILWDKTQYYNECCGVIGFQDWSEAAWVPQEQKQCSDGKNMTMVPFSCCKRTCESCFKSFEPQENSQEKVTNNLDDFNVTGCFQKFKHLLNQFINMVFYIWIFIILMQILLFLVMVNIYRPNNNMFNFTKYCENDEELPLVVVKYPRNVRCLAVADDDSFDEELGERENDCNKKCSKCEAMAVVMHQEVFENQNSKENIFVH